MLVPTGSHSRDTTRKSYPDRVYTGSKNRFQPHWDGRVIWQGLQKQVHLQVTPSRWQTLSRRQDQAELPDCSTHATAQGLGQEDTASLLPLLSLKLPNS